MFPIRLLTGPSTERVICRGIIDRLRNVKALTEMEEEKVELAEAIDYMRQFGDLVQRHLAEMMQDHRNREIAIQLRLTVLEWEHPQSVADLQAERARLEEYYYPAHPTARARAYKVKKKEDHTT